MVPESGPFRPAGADAGGQPAVSQRLSAAEGGRPCAELGRFLVLTALISAVPWIAVLLLGRAVTDPLTLALYALGACGPTLAALALRLRGVRSPRLARWAAVTRWATVAVVVGVLPALAAAVLAPLLGSPEGGVDGVSAAVGEQGGLLALLLVHTVTGPLSEEFGWRGFAQPRLRRRLSPYGTSLVLGTVWALWHLPFFEMPGTWQSTLSLPEALLYLVTMVPMSLVYWYVSERLRGGVPGAVLLHYVSNVSLALLPLATLVSFAVLAGTWLLLAVAVAAALLPSRRRAAAAR